MKSILPIMYGSSTIGYIQSVVCTSDRPLCRKGVTDESIPMPENTNTTGDEWIIQFSPKCSIQIHKSWMHRHGNSESKSMKSIERY